MGDPLVTPAIIGANCLMALIAGPLSNRADWAFLAASRKVGDILRRATPEQNQHIMRATQAAYVKAMRDMAAACMEISDDEASKAAAKELAALTKQSEFKDFRYDGEHFPLDDANAAIDRMFSSGIALVKGSDKAAEHRAFGLAVVRDLAVWGISLSERQVRLFTDGIGDHPAWHLRFKSAFEAELIRDDAARSIFTQERLGEIRSNGIAVLDTLTTLQARVDQGFTEVRQDITELHRALIEAVSQQRNEELSNAKVHLEALVQLAQRIVAHVSDPETALRELNAHVTELLDLRAEAAQGTNFNMVLNAVLRRIDEKAAAGEFEAADREASRAFDEWEAQERDRRDRAIAEGQRYAAANIRTKRFLRDAEGAAYWIARQIALASEIDVPGYEALAAEVERLIASGRDGGINLDLEIAAALARRMFSSAAGSVERAESQIWLGIALATLGERQQSTAGLNEAVIAYRAALEVYTREARPPDWARTQNNLGNALLALGQRQQGTAALDEAVIAYRAALEVRSREALPLDWAATQNNLGHALWALGERQQGTEALDEAVIAYQAALEVFTREAQPLDWAMTQNNLGIALATLAQRQQGMAALDEAVIAYRAALEVFTLEAQPVQWATTQNNLGNALAMLGQRHQSTAGLNEAVIAYRAALEVRSHEALPLDWAMTQNNLGIALATLGRRQQSTEALDEAVIAYHAALEVYTREALPVQWARTTLELLLARVLLMKQDAASYHLAQLRSAAEAAQKVLFDGNHEIGASRGNYIINVIDLIAGL